MIVKSKVKKLSNTRKTIKLAINKNYIIIEKYEKKILGVKIKLYIIYFNKSYVCKNKLTLKKRKLLKKITKKIKLFDYLTKNKISTTKIYKNDKDIANKFKNIIDPTEKYTYCLNNDKLILAETKTLQNKSRIKKFFSKHIIICNQNDLVDSLCGSGEFYIENNNFIFDNKSGSYLPTLEHLKLLQKLLSFLKIEIVKKL